MTITVVIANYKYEHLAAQAIESVLCQTRKADKIILVDDCSYPPYNLISNALVRSLAHKYNIEFLGREENLGIVANFQDVLQNHVTTDKALYLGADNWLRPDALEKMEAANVDICGSWAYLFGTEADEFRKIVASEWHDGYYVWMPDTQHGSSLYNVNLAKQVGYKRNPKSKNTEEDAMLFRGMKELKATFTVLKEPLLYYRRHKANFQ
jgi:glycosyltransferase involved in cell wall biosynthesis